MYLCKLNNVSTIHGNLVSTKSLTNHTIIVEVVKPNATINDKSNEIDLGIGNKGFLDVINDKTKNIYVINILNKINRYIIGNLK